MADGLVDPDRFITAEASLEDLPAVLAALARGGDGVKTAILPWAPGLMRGGRRLAYPMIKRKGAPG